MNDDHKPIDDFLEFTKEAEEKANEVIENNKKIFEQSRNYENTQEFRDYLKGQREKAKESNKEEAYEYEKSIAAAYIKEGTHEIKKYFEDENRPIDFSFLNLIYIVGVNRGILGSVSEVFDNHFDYLSKLVFSWRSSKHQTQRWRKDDARYEKAIEFANDLWKQGENRLHDGMAEYLLSMKQFEELSRKKLINKLKPIAQKYSKVRGERGNKKR